MYRDGEHLLATYRQVSVHHSADNVASTIISVERIQLVARIVSFLVHPGVHIPHVHPVYVAPPQPCGLLCLVGQHPQAVALTTVAHIAHLTSAHCRQGYVYAVLYRRHARAHRYPFQRQTAGSRWILVVVGHRQEVSLQRRGHHTPFHLVVGEAVHRRAAPHGDGVRGKRHPLAIQLETGKVVHRVVRHHRHVVVHHGNVRVLVLPVLVVMIRIDKPVRVLEQRIPAAYAAVLDAGIVTWFCQDDVVRDECHYRPAPEAEHIQPPYTGNPVIVTRIATQATHG